MASLDVYRPAAQEQLKILGEQTGVETLMQIKEKCPDTPVIIMTGFSSNELKQTTQNLGAVEHLVKPFQMSSLKTKVEEILSL